MINFENKPVKNIKEEKKSILEAVERKSFSTYGQSFDKLSENEQVESLKMAAKEHIEREKEIYSEKYLKKEEEAEKIILALTPDEDDEIMSELLGIMEEKGIINTIKALEKKANPHIQDDFHRFLVQYIKSGYSEIKEKSPFYPGLNMTLFEVSLPEEEEEDKEKNLEILLSSMEQFYAGMFSVAEQDKNNYFSIEIAYPPNREEIIFFVAIPNNKKNIFKNQVLAIFPDASIKEITDDYNIFNKKNFVAFSEGFLEKSFVLPIKTYKDFNYDPLNIILKSFSNLEKEEGAAIQIILKPDKGEFNNKLVKKINSLARGENPDKILSKEKDNFINTFLNLVEKGVGLKKEDENKSREENNEERMILMEEMKKKNSSRFYQVNLRLISSGNNQFQAESIIDELKAPFYQFENPNGNKFFFKTYKGTKLRKKINQYTYRIFDPKNFSVLNTSELTGIFHFSEKTLKAGDLLSSLSYASAGVSKKLSEQSKNLNSYFEKEKKETKPETMGEIKKTEWNKEEPVFSNQIQNNFEKEILKKDMETSISKSSQENLGDASFKNEKPILLGYNLHQGVKTDIFMNPVDRMRHLYVIGKSGVGKTSILKNMIVQDIENGDGVCFIDPHGSDIEDIMEQIPPERFDDVIYFDPTNVKRPMAMNMLEYNPEHPEQKTFVVNELFSIFKKLYSHSPESMGPAFEQYFRNATMLVLEHPESGNTMIEISRVLTDENYRNLKLKHCKNIIVKQFWEKIATQVEGENELANIVPYITNKFDVFMANDFMRPIISQEKSAFNFREVMDNKKILLVNLSKGKLGEMNSNLIGLILVGKILMAALSRVDSLDKNLPPFYLYIDEFQNVTTDSISQILSEARKYKLSLNIAHQYIKQIDEGIRDAVFGNVGSMITFRVGPEDAEFLEKQFAPTFTAKDILNLNNYNAYIKLLVNGEPQKPFNLITYPPKKGNPQNKEYIKKLSAEKFGRPIEEIEKEIEKKFNFG